MVSAISGSVPFSYLDQLQGTPGGAMPKVTAKPAAAPAPAKTDNSTSYDKTASLAKSLGLPKEIISLLQGAEEAPAAPTSSNNIASLLGDSANAETKANDILSKIYKNLLTSNSISSILKIAYQGAAAKQTAINLNTDPLDKILSDYNKAKNAGIPTTISTTNISA